MSLAELEVDVAAGVSEHPAQPIHSAPTSGDGSDGGNRQPHSDTKPNDKQQPVKDNEASRDMAPTDSLHIYVGENSVSDLQPCAQKDTYQLPLSQSTVVIHANQHEIKVDAKNRVPKMMMFLRVFYAYNIFMSFLCLNALSFKAILQVIYGTMIPTIRDGGSTSFAVFVSLYTIAVILYLAITLQISAWYMFLDTFMDFTYFLGDFNPNLGSNWQRSLFQLILHVLLFILPAMTFICVTLTEDIVEGYVMSHYVSIPSSLCVFLIFFVKQIYARARSSLMIHEKIRQKMELRVVDYAWNCAKRYVYYIVFPISLDHKNSHRVYDGWFFNFIFYSTTFNFYEQTEQLRYFSLLKDDIPFHIFIAIGYFICPMIFILIIPGVAGFLNSGLLWGSMFFFFFGSVSHIAFLYARIYITELPLLKRLLHMTQFFMGIAIILLFWSLGTGLGIFALLIVLVVVGYHLLMQQLKKGQRNFLRKKYRTAIVTMISIAAVIIFIIAIVYSFAVSFSWGVSNIIFTFVFLFLKFISIIPREPKSYKKKEEEVDEPDVGYNSPTEREVDLDTRTKTWLETILDFCYFDVASDEERKATERGFNFNLPSMKSDRRLYSHSIDENDKQNAVQEKHGEFLKRVYRTERSIPLPTSNKADTDLTFPYKVVIELLRSEEARRGLMFIWIGFIVVATLFAAMAAVQLSDSVNTFYPSSDGCYNFPPRNEAGAINYPFCKETYEGLSVLDYAYMAKIAYIAKENATQAIQAWTKGQFVVRKYPIDESNHVYYYDFYNPAEDFSVVSVRGTTLPFDWVQDADIWIEASLFQGIRTIIPFLHLWPQRITEVFIYSLSRLDKILTMSSDDYKNRKYYQEVQDYVAEIIPKRKKVVVTGHSLGGGIAQIAGVANKVPAVAFSGPGIMMSRLKFNKLPEKDIHKYALNIVPEKDVVPKVDVQGILAQHISCELGVASCHFLSNTICEIARVCGDPRGRGIYGSDPFCPEFKTPKPGC